MIKDENTSTLLYCMREDVESSWREFAVNYFNRKLTSPELTSNNT